MRTDRQRVRLSGEWGESEPIRLVPPAGCVRVSCQIAARDSALAVPRPRERDANSQHTLPGKTFINSRLESHMRASCVGAGPSPAVGVPPPPPPPHRHHLRPLRALPAASAQRRLGCGAAAAVERHVRATPTCSSCPAVPRDARAMSGESEGADVRWR
eukprot:364556-Chlamydomonas_euryale.AAC.9